MSTTASLSRRPGKVRASREKPSVKQDHVTEVLRREIMDGLLPPSGRLPPQAELIKRFDVSQTTITYAMKRLQDEGFVLARPREGTRVVPHLPYLTNIALVLPVKHRSGAHWSNYYTALTQAATQIRDTSQRPIRVFDGVDDLHGDGHIELTRLVRTQQVAGLFFAMPPFLLRGTPLLDEPGVPRVAVMGPPAYPGIATAVEIGGQFIEKALDYLVSRGRRRIAILKPSRDFSQSEDALAALLASRGMTSAPHWQIALSVNEPEGAKNIIRLMFHAGQRERPDGLIIANDNLVDDALAGLVAEGVKVPEALEVVTHCNFPWPPNKFMAVRRLGVDVASVIRTSIELIDRQRRGEPVPPVLQFPAAWEHEVGPL